MAIHSHLPRAAAHRHASEREQAHDARSRRSRRSPRPCGSRAARSTGALRSLGASSCCTTSKRPQLAVRAHRALRLVGPVPVRERGALTQAWKSSSDATACTRGRRRGRRSGAAARTPRSPASSTPRPPARRSAPRAPRRAPSARVMALILTTLMAHLHSWSLGPCRVPARRTRPNGDPRPGRSLTVIPSGRFPLATAARRVFNRGTPGGSAGPTLPRPAGPPPIARPGQPWPRRNRSISDASSSPLGSCCSRVAASGVSDSIASIASATSGARRCPPPPAARRRPTCSSSVVRSSSMPAELPQLAEQRADRGRRRPGRHVVRHLGPERDAWGRRPRPASPAARSARRSGRCSRCARHPTSGDEVGARRVLMTWTGRRCDAMLGMPPRVNARATPSRVAASTISPSDRAPPQRRLGPAAQHDVATGPPGDEVDRRPRDLARDAVDEPHGRTRLLEVHEVGEVDGREPCDRPRAARRGPPSPPAPATPASTHPDERDRRAPGRAASASRRRRGTVPSRPH